MSMIYIMVPIKKYLYSQIENQDIFMRDTVPNVVFKTRVRDESVEGPNPFRWQDRTTEEIFKGKKVIVFSLPGAFTPTCSSTHLPGYEKHFEEFKSLGVDEIISVSVNDAFVMCPMATVNSRAKWECWLAKIILALGCVPGVIQCWSTT